MENIHDVGRYLLSKTDDETGDFISNLKLQKLVYYAQGLYLALHDEPLFAENIEAWTYGPVIPSLYHEYKEYGSGCITPPTDFDMSVLTDEAREVLDEVYQVYGQFSGWKLRDMTHEEAPWQEAYAKKSSAKIISQETMKKYFLAQLN